MPEIIGNLHRRLSPGLLLLLVVALTAGGCGGGSPSDLPAGTPVILISIDTLRSDRLPAYGYDKVETPNLDRLAAESVLFERAYTHCPLTLPAHASLFTGLLPPDHGIRDNLGFRLPEEQVTLAERMKQAGYRTAGLISSVVLREETGISQGFQRWDDEITADPNNPAGRIRPQRSGDQTADRLVEILQEEQTEDPFFLFIHLYDPHSPRDAPEPFASRYPDPYDAEVAYTDHVVGRLIETLSDHGLFDRALTIVLSDHGEGLGDHVETEHGIFLYRETLQVPLMVRFPGGSGGGRQVSSPAFLIDMVPSILDLFGLPREGLPGFPLFGKEPPPQVRTLYGETWFGKYQYHLSELRTVLRGDLHYIEAPRPELYNLKNDPLEQENLIHRQAVPPSMLDTLKEIGHGTVSRGSISEEERSSLASLGYVGGSSNLDESRGGDDPKDHIATIEELWENVRKVGKDPTFQAEERFLEILPKLGIKNEPLSRTLANNMMVAGRNEIAATIMEPFTESNDIATLLLLGRIETDLGMYDQAAQRFSCVIVREPDYPMAMLGLGIVLLSQGRALEAKRHLEKAVQGDPDLAEGWNGLGVILAGEGNLPAAREAWEKTVRLDPGFTDAWFNLSRIARMTGDGDTAVACLRRYIEHADPAGKQEGRRILDSLLSTTE